MADSDTPEPPVDDAPLESTPDAEQIAEPAAEPEDKPLTAAQIRIQYRQERVKRLLARRMTIPEIAEALHVSERTISSDVAAVRAEMTADLSRTDALGMAATIQCRSEVRQRELWGMFGALKGTGTDVVQVKLQILRDLRAETKDELDALQKLGIVQRAPVEVLMHLRAVAALGQVAPAKLEAMAALPVDAFMRELAEVCGEDAVASWGVAPLLGAGLPEGEGEKAVGTYTTEAAQ